jgi:hypothetical protein
MGRDPPLPRGRARLGPHRHRAEEKLTSRAAAKFCDIDSAHEFGTQANSVSANATGLAQKAEVSAGHHDRLPAEALTQHSRCVMRWESD